MVLPTVLFVCARNACASLMAEAYLNTVAGGVVRAFSAGVEPAARADARALRAIAAAGLPMDGLAPKPLELFGMAQAPEPDVLVLLSAETLGRPEPFWSRPPRRLAWLLAEPDERSGPAAFARLMTDVSRRIDIAFDDGTFGVRAPMRHAV